MRTFCNPLNLPYQYQHYRGAAHREAADPTLVCFKGIYYLFPSMTGGFFYSYDLVDWLYHSNATLDMYRYAPDVHIIRERLVFTASSAKEPSIFRVTDDPFSDQWETVSEPFPFWDPALFEDEDGRVYLYWGCSDQTPIYGQELNPDTLWPIGEKVPLIYGTPETTGFERMPQRRRKPKAPYIEGAFVNRWNGKYYLQYAAPGTEFATYADGVYVADHPLGPYRMQVHNPFSSKPGGFITGAGHGSTIEDVYGNLWHAATMRISVNAPFERRVGLFPAGLDADGILYCNQSFADYPLDIPEGPFDPLALRPKWMLLSYQKPSLCSSAQTDHPADLAFNEDIRTCWCAEGSEGEWLQVDLGRISVVYAVQVNLADVAVPVKTVDKHVMEAGRFIDMDPKRRTRWILERSEDGMQWETLVDRSNVETDLPHEYIELSTPMLARYLRLTAVALPYHERFAVSGLRVFGVSGEPEPDVVTNIRARRIDPMTVTLRWNPSEYAHGYVVRYGSHPHKLYASHQVYGKTEVTLTMLNKEQVYYATVDAFGEGGVAEGTAVYSIR